jgi:hypothetical protein
MFTKPELKRLIPENYSRGVVVRKLAHPAGLPFKTSNGDLT